MRCPKDGYAPVGRAGLRVVSEAHDCLLLTDGHPDGRDLALMPRVPRASTSRVVIPRTLQPSVCVHETRMSTRKAALEAGFKEVPHALRSLAAAPARPKSIR